MEESGNSFGKDLDQLIRLFKKIRERTSTGEFSHLDPMFIQNLDFMINNYEMVKSSMPPEALDQMAKPFQELLRQFIKKLKEELGEDYGVESEIAGLMEEGEKDEKDDELLNDVQKIDMMLKNPGLSEEEINALLDKRSDILKNKGK